MAEGAFITPWAMPDDDEVRTTHPGWSSASPGQNPTGKDGTIPYSLAQCEEKADRAEVRISVEPDLLLRMWMQMVSFLIKGASSGLVATTSGCVHLVIRAENTSATVSLLNTKGGSETGAPSTKGSEKGSASAPATEGIMRRSGRSSSSPG